MFEEALRELIGSPGVELAIFCDYEGESIALAAPGRDPFDVRVLAAHHAPLVDDLQRIARRTGQSERLSLAWTSEQGTLLVEALPGGYYVLAGLRADAVWTTARPRLRRLADRFAAEL